jgi:adenosylcobinamide kinase/adenosylcobinamide-phosphate guanylyltransferase
MLLHVDRINLILVTGGARSGKSRFAEERVRQLAPRPPWLYLATAQAMDDEMRARIARHRAGRDVGFTTVEVAHDPATVLRRQAGMARAALLDCVTLWVSNRMHAGDDDKTLLGRADELAEAARSAPAPVVMVTNEVGAGIVPDNALARRFRDLAGLINQRLAARADEVVLMSCGLPLRLK